MQLGFYVVRFCKVGFYRGDILYGWGFTRLFVVCFIRLGFTEFCSYKAQFCQVGFLDSWVILRRGFKQLVF